MTQEQRDWGKVITIAILASILLVGALFGCTPMIYKSNQIKVTHVLALTENGDTIKVSIRDIKPTQIYNVIGYDFTRGYNNPYYNPWTRYHVYDNHYRYYTNHAFVDRPNYINQPYNNWHPLENFAPVNRGTTNNGDNPISRNPVTSGGGKKKNN
tara:strand:+ start:1251 stop:1715 length:465 start_codon:yes stop_codon:yes gene_type:complete